MIMCFVVLSDCIYGSWKLPVFTTSPFPVFTTSAAENQLYSISWG